MAKKRSNEGQAAIKRLGYVTARISPQELAQQTMEDAADVNTFFGVEEQVGKHLQQYREKVTGKVQEEEQK